METFYFTFGIGHALGNKVQQVVADDMEQARGTMCNAYGHTWAFGYTEQEFQQSINNGFFLNLEPLEPIYSKEVV